VARRYLFWINGGGEMSLTLEQIRKIRDSLSANKAKPRDDGFVVAALPLHEASKWGGHDGEYNRLGGTNIKIEYLKPFEFLDSALREIFGPITGD